MINNFITLIQHTCRWNPLVGVVLQVMTISQSKHSKEALQEIP